MSSSRHITWIPASALSQSWLPAHFEPRFVAVERLLAADPGRYVRLGEVVTAASLWPSGEVSVEWHVVRRGDGLVIEPAGDASKRLVQLPDECVVLHPLVFQGRVATTLWSSRLVGGNGATSSTCYALVSRDGQDAAWLEEAFADDIVVTQLERASAGGLVPLLRRSDLLDVRIPNLDFEERLAAGQRARGRLARMHRPPVPKHHVLTGASHEERLEQFERVLFDEAYALPGTSFFIQAVKGGSDPSSWTIRPLGQSSRGSETTVMPSPDDEAAAWWRTWYWQEPASAEAVVLNSLDGDALFPPELLVRLLDHVAAEPWHSSYKVRLPLFSDFRAAVESARDEDLDLDLANAEVARVWESANPGAPLYEDIFDWLRQVFRPILAIRVARSGKPAGAYLLFGPDQLERPLEVASHMELQGQRLAAMLEQPSEIAEDAARRESLRRLSWMMHQLSGPLQIIDGALEDVREYVDDHSPLGDALLPDEATARELVSAGQPLEESTFTRRLDALASGVDSIRRLVYLIRSYKNAHGEFDMSHFWIGALLRDLADLARLQLPGAQVSVEAERDAIVAADRAKIRAALSEVISNSCRELRVRKTPEPILELGATRRDRRVRIHIRDNALPVDVELIDDPFAEEASTYKYDGKGSGLGLTVVRDTFARHGGRCQLLENKDSVGARTQGVCFIADLARATTTTATEEGKDV